MKITARLRNAYNALAGEPAPKPVEGELAFADTRRLFPHGYSSPYNPDVLVRRQGLRVFDAMKRDDQVKAALAFKKHACISTGWTVTSPEGQPEDWEPTRFVKHVLENLDPREIGGPSLDLDLYEILTALDYGFSVTEKVWGAIERGRFAGKMGLRALKTRAPHGFLFAQDEFGNLAADGIVQSANTKVKNGRLPRDKFVLFTYEGAFGNPYGTSDLVAAYPAWWTKDNATKWLAMLLERLGIPPIFGLYNPSRYTPQQIDDLKDVIQHLQAATFGIIPRPDEKALDFWSPELAGQATRVFIPSLEYLNNAIARGILMPGLLGMTSDTSEGSFARAKVHFDVFLLVVEAIRRDLERVVMQHQIVRPLVDMNYAGVEDYPQWRFLPLTDDLRLELLKEWREQVSTGALTQQDEDEKHVRKLMKFPEMRPGAQRRPARSPAPAPAQPPAEPNPAGVAG